MFIFGYGISVDVQDLPFAALDGDRSSERRRPPRGADVVYEPTPPAVVDTLIAAANALAERVEAHAAGRVSSSRDWGRLAHHTGQQARDLKEESKHEP